MRIAGRARLDELIALSLCLEEWGALDERDRRRFDREIGAKFRSAEAPAVDGLTVLRHWLEAFPTSAMRERIRRVRSGLSLIRSLLLGGGVFLGWAAAAALLQVEVHAGRVNIILCLGLLVLVPLAMLIAGVLGAAWTARRAESSEAASRFSGGWRNFAIVRGVMALLPHSLREDLDLLLGRARLHDRLYGQVRRGQLFLWSQWMGLGFALGALFAAIAFVIFTDLAFGWSTTLDVDASRLHRLLRFFAAPFAGLWPEAAPTLDLVESTRHFRVASNAPHSHVIDPIRYGGWWPFLVMSILIYAVVPRGVATLYSSFRLRARVADAIARTPDVERLVERLVLPVVETQALEHEGAVGRPAEGKVPLQAFEAWRSRIGEAGVLALAWAESVDDALLHRLLSPIEVQVRDAGGRRSLDEDAERIAECGTSSAVVVLCVRAYEPPMLEVVDFLADLRAAVGATRPVAVFLFDGAPQDVDAWQRKLMSLADPALVCVTHSRDESEVAAVEARATTDGSSE